MDTPDPKLDALLKNSLSVDAAAQARVLSGLSRALKMEAPPRRARNSWLWSPRIRAAALLAIVGGGVFALLATQRPGRDNQQAAQHILAGEPTPDEPRAKPDSEIQDTIADLDALLNKKETLFARKKKYFNIEDKVLEAEYAHLDKLARELDVSAEEISSSQTEKDREKHRALRQNLENVLMTERNIKERQKALADGHRQLSNTMKTEIAQLRQAKDGIAKNIQSSRHWKDRTAWNPAVLPFEYRSELKVNFEFIDMPVKDCFAWLTRHTGLAIECGLPDTMFTNVHINLRVEDMQVTHALEWICRLANLQSRVDTKQQRIVIVKERPDPAAEE